MNFRNWIDTYAAIFLFPVAEITKCFGEAMHAVGSFFRIGEDGIHAGVMKRDGPKLILNSIGQNVKGTSQHSRVADIILCT